MAAAAWISGSAGARQQADAAEVVVLRRPAAHVQARRARARASACSSTPGSALTTSPARWNRGRSTASTGSRPSSRIPAATPTSAVRSRVPPAEPIASASPSPSSARLGAIMLCIRSPGASGSRTRSTSPSMLFRCRSRPGRKSPVPSPRLDVSTQTLPSASAGDEVRRVAVDGRPVERGEQRVHARGPVELAQRRQRGRATPARPRARARVRKRVPAYGTSTGAVQRGFVALQVGRRDRDALDAEQRLGERAAIERAPRPRRRRARARPRGPAGRAPRRPRAGGPAARRSAPRPAAS